MNTKTTLCWLLLLSNFFLISCEAESTTEADATAKAEVIAAKDPVKALPPPTAELASEQYSVETLSFPPSPHRAYLLDAEFDNIVTGRIVVVDPDEKKFLGMISLGFIAPMVLSKDDKTIYTADIFYSRGTRGERVDVITAHDTKTLSPKWEVEIPPRRSSNVSERFQFNLTDDDKFALVFNFTPATSVSVVDIQQRKFVAEIKIPGCSLNYPAGPRRFASICGDGNLLIVNLDEQGQEASREKLSFFDPKQDLIIERAAVKDNVYYFTSFKGQLYSVDMSTSKIKFGGPWPLVTEAEKKQQWRPGGWQLIAISPQDNLLFVLMHPDSYNGSHKDPSTIIWAYDLDTKQKVSTYTAEVPLWSIHTSNDDDALLYGLNIEGGLETFNIKSGKHTGTMPGIFKTPTYILTH